MRSIVPAHSPSLNFRVWFVFNCVHGNELEGLLVRKNTTFLLTTMIKTPTLNSVTCNMSDGMELEAFHVDEHIAFAIR